MLFKLAAYTSMTLVSAFMLLLALGLLLTEDQPEHAVEIQPESELELDPTPIAVVEQIKLLSELNTGISFVQTVVTVMEKSELFGISVGSAEILYVAAGQVRAGVDLSQITESDITSDGVIRVRLPKAKILSSQLDIENSYAYDVRESFLFAPDTISLHSEAQKIALDRVVSAALKGGILKASADNAAQVLEKFLEGFLGEDVIVEAT